jgi:hypothetical protein
MHGLASAQKETRRSQKQIKEEMLLMQALLVFLQLCQTPLGAHVPFLPKPGVFWWQEIGQSFLKPKNLHIRLPPLKWANEEPQ